MLNYDQIHTFQFILFLEIIDKFCVGKFTKTTIYTVSFITKVFKMCSFKWI